MIMQKTYISLMATLLLGLRASAIVFTNDTLISPLMTNYDGLDIVISNSVLTVDGPHSFASLRAATGSTLTHSASASGMVNAYTSISEDPHPFPTRRATDPFGEKHQPMDDAYFPRS